MNSRSFKELLINKRLETSSSPGYKLTNKQRTSYFYHVKFPHFLKELEVMTVPFLFGDCIFFSVLDFRHHHLCHTTSGLFSSSLLYLQHKFVLSLSFLALARLCRIKTGQTSLLEYNTMRYLTVLIFSIICTLLSKVE